MWSCLPVSPSHLWQDVDTIYLTQDTRELNLQDFIHLENRCASVRAGALTTLLLTLLLLLF